MEHTANTHTFTEKLIYVIVVCDKQNFFFFFFFFFSFFFSKIKNMLIFVKSCIEIRRKINDVCENTIKPLRILFSYLFIEIILFQCLSNPLQIK